VKRRIPPLEVKTMKEEVMQKKNREFRYSGWWTGGKTSAP